MQKMGRPLREMFYLKSFCRHHKTLSTENISGLKPEERLKFLKSKPIS